MPSTTFRTTTALALSALALTACSSEKIADNTTDTVVFVGKTTAKAAYGAGKLVVRGANAGARKLREPKAGYPAGTVVCLDEAGQIYAAAVVRDNVATCPPQGS